MKINRFVYLGASITLLLTYQEIGLLWAIFAFFVLSFLRLTDLNLPKVWLFSLLIPIVNIYILSLLLCAPSGYNSVFCRNYKRFDGLTVLILIALLLSGPICVYFLYDFPSFEYHSVKIETAPEPEFREIIPKSLELPTVPQLTSLADAVEPDEVEIKPVQAKADAPKGSWINFDKVNNRTTATDLNCENSELAEQDLKFKIESAVPIKRLINLDESYYNDGKYATTQLGCWNPDTGKAILVQKTDGLVVERVIVINRHWFKKH